MKQEGKYFKSYLILNDQIRVGVNVLIVRSLYVNGAFVGINGMLGKNLINETYHYQWQNLLELLIIPVMAQSRD